MAATSVIVAAADVYDGRSSSSLRSLHRSRRDSEGKSLVLKPSLVAKCFRFCSSIWFLLRNMKLPEGFFVTVSAQQIFSESETHLCVNEYADKSTIAHTKK